MGNLKKFSTSWNADDGILPIFLYSVLVLIVMFYILYKNPEDSRENSPVYPVMASLDCLWTETCHLFSSVKKTEELVAPISLYPAAGNGTKGDRIVEQLAYRPPNVSSEPLKILLWQGLHQDVWGGLNPQEGDEVFQRESCQVTNCVLTEDQDQLESSDLVLFRERVPDITKSSGQLWMIFSLEEIYPGSQWSSS